MKNEPLTLAIDTSCDETSVSVVKGFTVLSNVLPSQIEFHAKYGGVVPSLAKLAHQERIQNVIQEAVKKAQIKIEEIDFIAVTQGPGLAIALEVGIKKAKEIAIKYNKPLIAMNHMLGHMFSSFALRKSKEKNISIINKLALPALAFLISGGHTELVRVEEIGKYIKIGETLDDSCGEAFDKCGRMLGLGYPAGPIVSEFAKRHRKNMEIKVIKQNQSTLICAINNKSKNSYSLPIPMANSGDLNMSFSGLKTAFKQLIDKIGSKNLSKEIINDLCVAFEAAAIEQLKIKLLQAIRISKPKEVWLGGGVVASAKLKSELRKICKKYSITLRVPFGKKLTTDNAAMIGVASNILIQSLGGKKEIKKLLEEKSVSLENKGIYIENFEKIDRKPSLSL